MCRRQWCTDQRTVDHRALSEMGLAHTRVSATEIWEGLNGGCWAFAGVAPARLYSNVRNYYATIVIGNAYSPRVVDHRGVEGNTASASSLVSGFFLFKGGSMTG